MSNTLLLNNKVPVSNGVGRREEEGGDAVLVALYWAN